MTAARTRVRIKGTGIYLAASTSAYETTGWGRRSLAMRAPNYGPNSALQFAGTQLRDQGREAARNNGYAAAVGVELASNLIGTGIVPQLPTAKARKLWRDWTDYASADGTLDFYGQQAQVVRSLPFSGEVFIRLRIRQASDGLAIPLQIQVLESDFVPLDKNESLSNGGYIRQGIEFNAIGARVAYWMYRQHPGDAVTVAFDPMPYRVPASEVLHVFDPMARPGQIRGEPWITRALAKLKDLDQYDDAELVRKKVSALLAGFIKRSVPQDMSEADLIAAWGDGSKVEDGVGGVTLEPGSMSYLEPGEEVEWSAPHDVGGQYEVFMREQKRAIAISAGLLYEQLTGDYSNLNDRTWRAAFNGFVRRCGVLQHSIIVFQMCRPILERWCAVGRIVGALDETDTPARADWMPQAHAYINPVQDIEAQQAEVRAGFASRTQKVTERGLDAGEIDAQQATDNERADKLGVKYDSDGRNAASAKPKPDAPAPDQGKPAPKAPK